MIDSHGMLEGERYWTAVKFDLPDKRIVDEFNAWYTHIHVPEIVENEGYLYGWRSGELRDAPNAGSDEQEFWAIYLMDSVERMRQLHAGPQAAGSSPPVAPPAADPKRILGSIFRKVMANHGRPFYQVLSSTESDGEQGRCFAREEFDLDGSDADKAAFEEYCRLEYLPKTLELSGVHRVWQLRHVATDLQLGANPAGTYLHLFEVDEPTSLLQPGRPEMTAWTKEQAGANVVERGRHFAEILTAIQPNGS